MTLLGYLHKSCFFRWFIYGVYLTTFESINYMKSLMKFYRMIWNISFIFLYILVLLVYLIRMKMLYIPGFKIRNFYLGLSLEQVDILWHCLVEDSECYDDALHWFLNQVRSKDQHAMGMETYKHLFLEKVILFLDCIVFLYFLFLSWNVNCNVHFFLFEILLKKLVKYTAFQQSLHNFCHLDFALILSSTVFISKWILSLCLQKCYVP